MQSNDLRATLKRLLGIPSLSGDLAPEARGIIETDGIVIEKWIITSEKGSRIPLNLYRPLEISRPVPAVIQTCGHGGSKGVPQFGYAARAYARMGIACLNADPLGEEERNPDGALGTREHDKPEVAYACELAGRSVMGKFVFDSMRALDFLETLAWIDPTRLGVMGNSLGGAVAAWLLALEPRTRMTIVSGWALSDFLCRTGKHCTRVPNRKLRAVCEWRDFLQLGLEHSRLLIMNGDADTVIDKNGSGTVWRDMEAHIRDCDPKGESLQTWWCPEGGHRPYQAYKAGMLFAHAQLSAPHMTAEQIADLPERNYGEWCDQNGIELEKLYGTQLHYRGAVLPDLGLDPIPHEELAVLKPEEAGTDDFTIQGWLKAVEKD